ncbi:sugar kinase [Adhaeribacter aquaticus]|uniref:sugar kinase n=1 Tax=Adhaeribacter aquaticus TaxID=299567 RepID=UPI000553A930|nr:sugar kinase [Adhaeribacter aquaticus]
MEKGKVLAFGELLWRLASVSKTFGPAEHLQVFPGGAEANAVSNLGLWQIPISYLTVVPDNELSAKALGELENAGVDTSVTIKQGDRMGLYFLLSANGLTTGQVVYDRKYSAFSQLTPGMIDWETILDDYSWFHWSALTPALSENLAGVCKEALEVAHRKGLTISVDLNYRNRLWDYGKTPLEIMPELVQYCDIIMGNIWASNKMLGTPIDESLDRNTGVERYLEYAELTSKAIIEKHPQCKHVAFTYRFMDNPGHNLFYGTYYDGSKQYNSAVYETNELIDRIGSGDAFMAGLIYSLYNGLAGQEVIDFTTSAAFQKLFVHGDFGKSTLEQVKENILAVK